MAATNPPPPGTVQNTVNTTNPVANPVVPVSPPPVNKPGGGYVSSDAQVQAQIQEMQRQAYYSGSKPVTTQAGGSPGTAAGSLTTNVSPAPPAMPITATNQPTVQQFQTYTPPTAQAQQQAQIQEVARLNGISLEEAAVRYNNAAQFQQGNVAFPAMNVPGQTPQGKNGMVYDPATGTYKDPLTGNFYGGFDPKLGHIFTSDQKDAIGTMFQTPDKGVMTSEDLNIASSAISNGINFAKNNPLPSSGLVYRNGATVEGGGTPGTSVGTNPGSEWETSLPPELQSLLDTIKTQSDALIGQNDQMDQLIKGQQDRLEARERATEADIHSRAEKQIEDQKIANKQAEAMVKTRMAALGATGSTQELQYLRDTIAGGERALRDIADSERKAVTEAQMAFEDKDLELSYKRLELADTRRKEYMELQEKQYNLKQDFQDKLQQRALVKRQMAQIDREERQEQMKTAQETMKLMLDSGASPDDIPEETYDAWGKDLNVNGATMKGMMKTAEKARNIQNAKDMADVYKSAVDIAAGLEFGKTMSIPLPDGGYLDITGQMGKGGKVETFTATLGTNKYGKPGQYILAKDASGNIVNAQYIGDHYVSPQLNPDTGEWTTYDPSNNTTTTVFNDGEFGEGTASIGIQNGFTQNGIPYFPTKGGYTLNIPRGGDVTLPIKQGTVLRVNDSNSAAGIASAIKKVESNGNYQAKGGSGEFGAYQFMPSTWKSWAGTYLGDPNAPMTQQNQDTVAEAKIQDLLEQGYDAGQIALIWNGGSPKVKKGVNKFGVAYDSGAYMNKVLNAQQQLGGGMMIQDQDTGAIYRVDGLAGMPFSEGDSISGNDRLGMSFGKVSVTPYTANGKPVLPQDGPQKPVDEISQFEQEALPPGTKFNPKSQKQQAQFSTWKQNKAKTEQEGKKMNFENTTNLRKEFSGRSEVKELIVTRDSYSVIDSLSQNRGPDGTLSGAGDISLIFAYMKMLDPNSTVREGEQATASNSGGIAAKIQNIYNNALKGNKLTGTQVDDFRTQADSLYQSKLRQVTPTINQYRTLAESNGLNPDEVVIDVSYTESMPPAGETMVIDGITYTSDGTNWIY